MYFAVRYKINNSISTAARKVLSKSGRQKVDLERPSLEALQQLTAINSWLMQKEWNL